jgi:hypothetical protein
MSGKFAVSALDLAFVTFADAGELRAQSSIDLIIGSDAGGGYDVFGGTVMAAE